MVWGNSADPPSQTWPPPLNISISGPQLKVWGLPEGRGQWPGAPVSSRAGPRWAPREVAQVDPSAVPVFPTTPRGWQVGLDTPTSRWEMKTRRGPQLPVLFVRFSLGTCWSRDQVETLVPETGDARTKAEQLGCQGHVEEPRASEAREVGEGAGLN